MAIQFNPTAPQIQSQPQGGAGAAGRAPQRQQVAQSATTPPGTGDRDAIVKHFGSEANYRAWCIGNGFQPLQLVKPIRPAGVSA